MDLMTMNLCELVDHATRLRDSGVDDEATRRQIADTNHLIARKMHGADLPACEVAAHEFTAEYDRGF